MDYLIKEIESGLSYSIKDGCLWRHQSVRESGAPIIEYRLDRVKKVVTIDSIGEDQKRSIEEQKDSEAQRIQNRGERVLLGAALGAGMDALSGDDSIVDGMLLGGLFGYASAGSSANARAPVAHIVICFSDGEKLPLIVDQKAMSLLVSKIEIDTKGSSERSKIVRGYNESEIESDRELVTNMITLCCSLIIGSIVFYIYYYYFLEPLPAFKMDIGMGGRSNGVDTDGALELLKAVLFNGLSSIFILAFSVGGSFILIGAGIDKYRGSKPKLDKDA